MEKSILICCLLAVTALSFINKQDVPVVQASVLNEPLKPAPVINKSEASPVTAIRPEKRKVAVRQSEKPLLTTSIVTPIIKDTVPTEKVTELKKLRFEGISRQVNDDGKTRTESVIATDKEGKKYSFNRNNGKVSDLKVDGKAIPDSEIKDYSDVLDRIDTQIEEGNRKRERASEERKTNLRRQQESRERKREEILERAQENRSRRTEESRVSDRQRVERLSKEDESDRVKEQSKLNKIQRKHEETQKNIDRLKQEQIKIQRKIENENKKLIETQKKIEIETNSDQQKKNDKSLLQKFDYKMNLVKNFDVQNKIELQKKFKVEQTKFDVKTEVWMKDKIKFDPAVPKTPKPPTPPKKDEPTTPETKQGS